MAGATNSSPYAELHCHTNFSFLDGASHPEELVEEAARLGLAALAVTDHDGFYGVVRFAEAARTLGLPTVFGTELTLGLGAARFHPGRADPPGEHLVVLAEGPVGYARLARAISEAQLRGEKGAPRLTLEQLGAAAAPAGGPGNRWYVLTRGAALPRRAPRGVRARPGARRALGPR
jgi:error-prone DNA polymerase